MRTGGEHRDKTSFTGISSIHLKKAMCNVDHQEANLLVQFVNHDTLQCGILKLESYAIK